MLMHCIVAIHVTRAIQTLLYIEMIEREAARKGGALYSLLGNHEIMTVCMAVISRVLYDIIDRWRCTIRVAGCSESV